MSRLPSEKLLQISAGNGPVECAWAVTLTAKKLLGAAAECGLQVRTIEVEPGPEKDTAYCMLFAASGANVDLFASSWQGTVQWTGQSPFRPDHKRKNWFVGIDVMEAVDEKQFDFTQLRWETMRASGPGGQHVNRTESAVRVTHLASGIQAVASEERSQHSNRRLALARLETKISQSVAKRHAAVRSQRWRTQNQLERGNPVRCWRFADADK